MARRETSICEMWEKLEEEIKKGENKRGIKGEKREW